ncbi:MAG: galactokinase [Propionibacteriaceae bacterium]|jgi:galactokinase|nr:galactokinase [Propionibacteriaceae bacterium]
MNGLPFEDSWSLKSGAQRVREGFIGTFGFEPAGVWYAPGRVNIIGEHTDYNNGVSAPIAIPHRTFAAVAPSGSETVKLASAQMKDTLWEVDMKDVAPGQVSGWGAYVAGTIWGMRKRGFAAPAIYGYVDSCVPFGAGLSSSASLSCSFAIALAGLLGLRDDDALRGQLVAAARDAENLIVGAPTGGLDQNASMRAQDAHMLLIDFRSGQTRQVPFDLAEAGLELLVIDTRATHQLSDGQYGARRASCEKAAKMLGVPSLREAEDLAAAMRVLGRDTIEGRRAHHVITEIARTFEFADLASAGRWSEMGPLFAASHLSLQDDYEVSVPELDVAVESAVAGGALAARMTGGGFGGSAIALVPVGTSYEVAARVCAAFEKCGFGIPAFLKAVAAIPAGQAQ